MKDFVIPTERDRRQLDTLAEITESIRDGASLSDLAQSVVDVLDTRLHYAYGSVLLLDNDNGRLDPLAVCRHGRDDTALSADFDYVRSWSPHVGLGLTGWVARSGESILIDDVRSDTRYLPVRDEIRSELCVPMQVGSRIWGVLNVESNQSSLFDENDRWFLGLVAVQLGLATCGAAMIRDEQPPEVVTVCNACKRMRAPDGEWLEAKWLVRNGYSVQARYDICAECMKHGPAN